LARDPAGLRPATRFTLGRACSLRRSHPGTQPCRARAASIPGGGPPYGISRSFRADLARSANGAAPAYRQITLKLADVARLGSNAITCPTGPVCRERSKLKMPILAPDVIDDASLQREVPQCHLLLSRRAAAAVDPDTRSCGTPPPARSARFRAAATIN